MNKANECTCPSGDGSLVHPCPAHPAVEQAGTNVGHGHVFPRADGVKMRCGGPALCSECAADAYRARAALAQPSGEVVVTKNESGAIVSVTRQDKEGRVLSVIAESATLTAQAEKAEVVARVVHSNPVVLGQCGPLNANDELMTVAQHAASVARWAEMFNRVEQQRDAAMARVAELEAHCVRLGQGGAERYWENRWRDADARLQELEKQEPVATVAKVPGEDWNSLDFHRDLQDMQPGTKLYTAPVAQAQHSVPDGVTVNPEALRQVVRALVGPAHHIRELQVTASLPGSPITELVKQYNAWAAGAPGKEGA
ncbi:hypothetical protein [Pseudomonas aeruginosa]|uniref:hypothetical protein n=1 Tax=Pseudomonas aeruginosa TaxID=287 RepID=UPI0009ACB83D|nr:hypothetical protein [Pseudomonas aeruginosa]OPE41559.1 hypothetical protein APB65_34280 [Pseudomonas aeruginosa]